MKRIAILLLAAALVGCKDDKSNILNPDAKIAINPAVRVEGKAGNTKHLSDREIVKQTTIMSWWNPKLTHTKIERGFNDDSRDTINNRLFMLGMDVIHPTGKLAPEFIEGQDFILEAWYNEGANNPDFHKDTIAYIPNVQIRAAEIKIKEAYAAKDYAECYRLMDETFTYTPITAAEWRALKAANKN